MNAPLASCAAESRREFVDLSTDELRERAVKTDNGQANWNDWTREMLIAFFQNRFGRYVPSAD